MFKSTWDIIQNKILQLAEFDRQFAVFGADHHRYSFRPVIIAENLDDYERQHGFKLPEELRYVYEHIGNGGVGPFYGLRPLDECLLMQPGLSYPGESYYRAKKDAGEFQFDPNMSEETILQMDDPLQRMGVICIIDQGCGQDIGMVTAGDLSGSIIYSFSEGHFQDTNQSLADIYLAWLDREMKLFQYLENMVRVSSSWPEIRDRFESQVERIDTEAYLRSLLDIPRTRKTFFGTMKPLTVEEYVKNMMQNSSRKWWRFW
ncbi:MAG: SMI1/KNR4 family protein [Planctomycetaceae bacterium]